MFLINVSPICQTLKHIYPLFIVRCVFLQIIGDVLHIDKNEIREDTTLIEDLCADSLDLYEIVAEIGITFEVEISTEAVDHMVTVGDVLRAIQSSGREI